MNRFVILDHLGRHQISHITHSARVLMLVANCSLDPCSPSVMNINEGKFTSWSSWFEADWNHPGGGGVVVVVVGGWHERGMFFSCRRKDGDLKENTLKNTNKTDGTRLEYLEVTSDMTLSEVEQNSFGQISQTVLVLRFLFINYFGLLGDLILWRGRGERCIRLARWQSGWRNNNRPFRLSVLPYHCV